MAIEEKYPEVGLLVKGGREKGYLLYEEIHTILSDEATAVPKDLELIYERFFELGKRVVSSPNPVAIFLAGCRECLPEWELQAAKPTRAEGDVSNVASCPRGQNPA